MAREQRVSVVISRCISSKKENYAVQGDPGTGRCLIDVRRTGVVTSAVAFIAMKRQFEAWRGVIQECNTYMQQHGNEMRKMHVC